MTFGTTPKDANNIPIGCVYVPSNGFQALQGSTTTNTDGSGNQSAPANFNLTQVNSAANSAANPVIVEPNAWNWLRSGAAYSVALSNGSGSAGVYALSVFNAATAKNILIYSIKTWSNSGFNSLSVQAQTSNPSFDTSITPVNAKLGGASSALASTCTYSSGVVSLSGTLIDSVNGPGAAQIEALNNGTGFLLPAGANNGIVVSSYCNASTGYSFVIKYIEY